LQPRKSDRSPALDRCLSLPRHLNYLSQGPQRPDSGCGRGRRAAGRGYLGGRVMNRVARRGIVLGLAMAASGVAWGQDESSSEGAEAGKPSSLVAGMTLRGIGPAFMSGRVVDIAVDPVKRS